MRYDSIPQTASDGIVRRTAGGAVVQVRDVTITFLCDADLVT